MLPRQPLRFLQPDDPGAGKTSMAGLFIKELTRGDFDRCLVVSPSSLAARFEGRFRDSIHQVEVSDLMRRLVKEIRANSTRRRCFLGRRLYRSVQALASRLAPPPRGYGFCAHRIFTLDDRDAILAKLAGRRHRPRARGRRLRRGSTKDDHEVELADPPKIT